MTQPGWYSDPHGSGHLRWWDGHRWTEHLHAPRQGEQLSADVRGAALHADRQGLAHGDASMPWADVEWVAYWPAQPSLWAFQVGRHPFQGGPRVQVVLDAEELWTRLVELCRELVEPRLVDELATRVRGAEQVDVAQGLTLDRSGVRGGRVALSWPEVAQAAVRDGRVWLHRTGAPDPVLYVPQQNPNAVLIPALLEELRDGTA